MADESMTDVADRPPGCGSGLADVVGMIRLCDMDQWVEMSVGHVHDPTPCGTETTGC
jgi:hypothetical protein